VRAGEFVAPQHFTDEVEAQAELFLNLIRAAEDVAVVLREGAHACEAAQFARLLVAVERGELGEAQRQFLVRVQAHLFVQRHVAGAVHGLEAERDALVFHRREHRVFVVVVVA